MIFGLRLFLLGRFTVLLFYCFNGFVFSFSFVSLKSLTLAPRFFLSFFFFFPPSLI